MADRVYEDGFEAFAKVLTTDSERVLALARVTHG